MALEMNIKRFAHFRIKKSSSNVRTWKNLLEKLLNVLTMYIELIRTRSATFPLEISLIRLRILKVLNNDIDLYAVLYITDNSN